MKRLAGSVLISAFAVASFASPLSDVSTQYEWREPTSYRQVPWSFWLGAFGDTCGPVSQVLNEENPGLNYLGVEAGFGYSVEMPSVSLRFASRVQSYGVVDQSDFFSLRTQSVLGVDALARVGSFYAGPGIGVGYLSARPSGLAFSGAGEGVFSLVGGYTPSKSTFVEMRLQTGAVNSYDLASLNLGVRF
jgi:hypothetical protein